MSGRWFTALLTAVSLLLLGCSGSKDPAPPLTPPTTPIVVTLNASSVPLGTGQTTTFTATVTGTTNTAVTWSLLEPTGGSITSAGLYTAPATAGSYHVVATSVADTSKSAQATVIVTATLQQPVIAYNPSILNGTVGTAITAVTPTNTGGVAASWNISPALPAWATFNATTGRISGTPTATSTTTTYTVSATNTAGTGTTAITLTVTAVSTTLNYASIYESGLTAPWLLDAWNDVTRTAAAAVPAGHVGTAAVEATFNAPYTAIGFRQPYSGANPPQLNEAQTLEFDLYLVSGSGDGGRLGFLLNDTGLSDDVPMTSLFPGWAGMSNAQRYNQWHHITVNLHAINATRPDVTRFYLYYEGAAGLHIYLASVRLGYRDRVTPPIITLGSPTLSPGYDQLTLPFTTDEATRSGVEFGVGAYNQAIALSTDYATTRSPILTGLLPGTTVQYRITALDHRIDPAATPNQGTLLGTYVIPPAPTVPPVISNLAATGITGNRANLTWNTNRPCTAVVTYQRNGGTLLTRHLTTFNTAPSLALDLLEANQTYSVTLTVTDTFALIATTTTSFTTSSAAVATVTITVDPAATRPISPYIYGTNFYGSLESAPRNLTLNRAGGNRWTTYNWENNASNAGSDWGPFASDGYLGDNNTPGDGIRSFITASQGFSMASLITAQLQGYVAADKSGNVAGPYPNLSRFKQVAFKKGTPFTTTPSTADANVYMDEMISALQGMFSPNIFVAGTLRPTFISLDNEPDLWNSTHEEVQGTALPPVATFNTRSVDLARAIKDVAPEAKVFGPVVSGFYGLASLGGLPGYTATHWFTDDYLTAMKAASDTYGRRLLDVYDFHWYPEARSLDTNIRVAGLRSATLTDGEVQAIVQASRSLWDHTYQERSWIANDWLGAPIYLLDRIQAKIDAAYPGTPMAITEYDPGGAHHIAGALAQADNLGIFGAKGVYAATYWDEAPRTGGDLGSPFILAGFKMYRDFDGAMGTFGDLSLSTTSSDTSKVAAYISRDTTRPGRTVIVVINRSNTAQDVGFQGLAQQGTATLYRLDGTADATNPTPVLAGTVSVNLATWVVSLPAYSVSTIVVE